MAIDKTDIGDQHVLPGAERITERTMLERRFQEPQRAGVVQRSPGGMFAAPEPEQLDIVAAIKAKGGAA